MSDDLLRPAGPLAGRGQALQGAAALRSPISASGRLSHLGLTSLQAGCVIPAVTGTHYSPARRSVISMWMNLDESERVAEWNGLLGDESHGMATHQTVREQMDLPWNSHMSFVCP